jgi:hypothetical protein
LAGSQNRDLGLVEHADDHAFEVLKKRREKRKKKTEKSAHLVDKK